jgi:hypothetical protein
MNDIEAMVASHKSIQQRTGRDLRQGLARPQRIRDHGLDTTVKIDTPDDAQNNTLMTASTSP